MRVQDHEGHETSLFESASVWYSFTIEEDQITIFDSESGDGEGDYVFSCHTCNETGPLPDDIELDFI